MTKIAWNAVGTRKFETGVDHGVLYFYDDADSTEVAVPWNGLVSIEDNSAESSTTPYYLDGVKYLDSRAPSDYSGRITAFTYPDEFDLFMGVEHTDSGIDFQDQESFPLFNLSYRTLIGNDLFATAAGYKIHLLYNLTATANSTSHSTLAETVTPGNFSWNISGIPVAFDGRRPTSHVVVNSTKVSAELLSEIEDIVYGTSTTIPRLPTATEFNDWL